MMSTRYFASNTFYDHAKKHEPNYLTTHFSPGDDGSGTSKGSKKKSKNVPEFDPVYSPKQRAVRGAPIHEDAEQYFAPYEVLGESEKNGRVTRVMHTKSSKHGNLLSKYYPQPVVPLKSKTAIGAGGAF